MSQLKKVEKKKYLSIYFQLGRILNKFLKINKLFFFFCDNIFNDQ